jgi:hypothetical protein
MDKETGKIIYDRQLKEGRGSSLYGIEVCRSLKLPVEFLKMANQVRQELQEESFFVVEPKRSKYNEDVFVSSCQLCSKPAKETHHLRPQKEGNPFGLLHARFNLMVLCEECHLKQHHGDKVAQTYIQTSEGVEVSYEIKKNNEKKENVHDYLKYTVDGWMVRLSKRHKWKSLTLKNYPEMAVLLKKYEVDFPMEYSEFQTYAEEKQSFFFEF